MLERLFNLAWYGKFQWTWVFWPLALIYGFVVNKKRSTFLSSKQGATPVPVIVVGNITVGGTGKTPVVQAIVRHLQKQGFQPGIISRGYGGSIDRFPHLITGNDASHEVGDEPYMLASSLSVPVVIDPIRKQALERVLEEGVNVVISDDGLQHYGLNRDVEICVVDGSRGLGNQQLIPVGPMREPKTRLDHVDYVLTSGKSGYGYFMIKPVCWVNLATKEKRGVGDFIPHEDALALAGIGNPSKFFDTLNSLGIHSETQAYPDHYGFSEQDFKESSRQVLMTEKDAVKIARFAHSDMWYLEIQAELAPEFLDDLTNKIGSK